jgi:hypothetical protein
LEHTKEQVSNNVIGDINADWKAGLNNSITQNLNLSFLLDMQKEGCFLSDTVWLRWECIFLPLIMN